MIRAWTSLIPPQKSYPEKIPSLYRSLSAHTLKSFCKRFEPSKWSVAFEKVDNHHRNNLRKNRAVYCIDRNNTAMFKPSFSRFLVDGEQTEVLEIKNKNSSFNVLVVPGNPGVVPFYEQFLSYLNDALGERASLVAISHLGHLVDNNGKLFSLEDQIKHKIEFLSERLQEDKTTPWILVGHSIGSHISFEAFKALQSPQIRQVVCTYPFLSLNNHSSWQSILNFASHRQLLSVVLFGIVHFLGKLSILQGIARVILGQKWSSQANNVFSKYMLNYGVLRNYGFMGMTEFDTLPVGENLNWEEYRKYSDNLAFIFGEDDHWGPLFLQKKISKEIPNSSNTVEMEGHDHAFVCSEEGSKWVAFHCAKIWREKYPDLF